MNYVTNKPRKKKFIGKHTLFSEQPRFLPLLALAAPRNDVLTSTSFGTVLYFIIASCT
jgi:hypothetical protein